LVLVNCFEMRPLYVGRGRERIKRVLAVASAGCTRERLSATFPDDEALIRLNPARAFGATAAKRRRPDPNAPARTENPHHALSILRHNFVRLYLAALAPQHGHRGRVLMSTLIKRARMVAIEFGKWRSGRKGGSPGSITVG
jgi:hypothetical protein